MKNLAARLVRKPRRWAGRQLRQFRGPFADDKPLLVHCAHHKMGTVWFGRVLKNIADHYGMPLTKVPVTEPKHIEPPKKGILLAPHSELPMGMEALPAFRGSHMVRDPRDVVVSGYFYHVWTTEKWAHIPRDLYGGKTYQEYLNSMSQEDGILAEMNEFSRWNMRYLREWDFNDPRFLEIRYEEFIADEEAGWRSIFRHYGFTDKAMEASANIAMEFSFKRIAKRDLGETGNKKSHLRSGRPGEWKEVFTEAHKQRFNELMGADLIRMGYSPDE